jgi:hypothetical protein
MKWSYSPIDRYWTGSYGKIILAFFLEIWSGDEWRKSPFDEDSMGLYGYVEPFLKVSGQVCKKALNTDIQI